MQMMMCVLAEDGGWGCGCGWWMGDGDKVLIGMGIGWVSPKEPNM